MSIYPKDAYVGNPVRVVAHACPVCGKKECRCHKGSGVCSVVVDDANNKVYLYGNIQHENYHQPGGACIAYTAVESAGFQRDGRLAADEWFEGEQDNNNVVLEHVPLHDNSLLVFLNGIKQREGAEYDYTINNKAIHFNFYALLPTDRVEVMYEYGDC